MREKKYYEIRKFKKRLYCTKRRMLTKKATIEKEDEREASLKA